MYRNLLDVLSKTIKRGGLKGLYQGLDSQLIKGLFSFGTTMVSATLHRPVEGDNCVRKQASTDISSGTVIACAQVVKARIETLFVMLYFAIRNRRAELA